MSDGAPAVLKLGFPRSDDLCREADALDAFGGDGMVRLLKRDLDEGALLLERIVPGRSLVASEDDGEATHILARTMLEIRRPEPLDHRFLRVSDWMRGFDRLRQIYDGGTGPVPERLVREVEEISSDLISSTVESSLLHGDLHHDNVLDAGDGRWTAIDPKGVVGDAAYEPAAMLYNPVGVASRPNLASVLRKRLDIICDVTGFDPERVTGWAFAQAVLASYWTLEDHGRVGDDALVFVRTLSDLRL